MLPALEQAALAATRALSVVGLAPLMGLAGMTLADGLMRWIANQPIEGVRDLGGLAIAVAIACCIPMVMIERGNITIRLAAGRQCPAWGACSMPCRRSSSARCWPRWRWQIWIYAAKMARAHETTFVLQIPIAPFWFGVDVILWCAVAGPGALSRCATSSRVVLAMTPLAIGGLGLAALFALILAQVPIGFAMIIVGVVGLALQTSWAPALTVLANEPVSVLSNVDLATVPLFLLMGTFADRGRSVHRHLQRGGGGSRPSSRRARLRDHRRIGRVRRHVRLLDRDRGDLRPGRAARNAEARLLAGIFDRHDRRRRHAQVADPAVDRHDPLLHRDARPSSSTFSPRRSYRRCWRSRSTWSRSRSSCG